VSLGNLYNSEKLSKIFNLLKKNMPNIIVLHSLTIENYNELINKLGNDYEPINIYKSENLSESTVILLHKKTINFEKKAGNPYYFDLMDSNNKIIGAEIQFNDKIFHIIATHFDDKEENDSKRVAQFNSLISIIKSEKIKHALIAGNFEISNNNEELDSHIINTVPEFKDAWISMGCPQHIRNTNYNLKLRTERIYTYKLKNFHINSMSLFGYKNVSDTINSKPAESYGLLARYSIGLGR